MSASPSLPLPPLAHLPLPTGRASRRGASARLTRALYMAKQRSVAAVFGPAAGLWHSFNGARASKGDPRFLEVIEGLHSKILAQDYADAEADLYPKSIILGPPGWYDARYWAEAIFDVPRLYRRKRSGEFRLGEEHLQHAETLADMPKYYLRTFHWQTDGWLSAHSARVYELQVEFLFFGTMDVMRRRALAALVRALGGDRRRMRVRVLDVGCGTGRFLEQARAAMPEATLEGVDLSPYYVERARRRLARASTAPSRVRVANGEALGGEDGAYDAVTCGFLFHELPREARQHVLAEMFRVLEPGGVAVVQDSMQRMDPNGRGLEGFLDWFPVAYHEPYYKTYVQEDLATLVEEAGFRVVSRDYPLFSKVIVAQKPRDASPAPARDLG